MGGSGDGDSARLRLLRQIKMAATNAMRAKTPRMGPTIAPTGVDLCDGAAVLEEEGVDEAEVEPDDADELLGGTKPRGLGVTRK